MTRNLLITLATACLFPAIATAQLNCTDNEYPVTLVDALGVPAPVVIDPVTNASYFQFDDEAVYMAFDPTMPSGTYYVHVTDPIGGADLVLSTNDPMDRFVEITNNAGVIALSLPFSANTPVTGLGLNGVGESLLLQPFTTNPAEPCRFKAWCGNYWDLSNGPDNPYLLLGGLNPNTGQCAIRSYESFRIGDGTGTDVTGCVFHDQNQNGSRDPGEPGLPGWTVHLSDAQTSIATLTGGDGCYEFVDVACNNYTVELTVQAGYYATTPTTQQIEVCGCANVAVAPFGVAMATMACDGHTPGFWRNKHGLDLIEQYGILATLPALGIVDRDGNYVAPATRSEFRTWLRRANSVNMAYMLSAQLVAMHCNVLVGFVDAACVIDDPQLGQVTIANLMQQAVASLLAHPYTPSGHPERAAQAAIKNALDEANNNANWL